MGAGTVHRSIHTVGPHIAMAGIESQAQNIYGAPLIKLDDNKINDKAHISIERPVKKGESPPQLRLGGNDTFDVYNSIGKGNQRLQGTLKKDASGKQYLFDANKDGLPDLKIIQSN